jgi:zinc/manganese transport system substrate-binding protein
MLGSAAYADDKVPVVASFSILGDIVQEIGGERVTVSTLVGANADAHVFQPAPQDAKRVAEAKLVVTNGLGFEGWIDRLIKASGRKPMVVVASKGINPIESKDDHGHGGLDPHAWQDVDNVKRYAATIAAALAKIDPEGANDYAQREAVYQSKLDALDAEIKASIAAIPVERRKLITSHDAFGYFAKAYGMTMIAPQGVSTETEASAKDVAKIIRQIKAEKISTMFLENVTDPRLIEQISRETGIKIGGKLYSDALSAPDGLAGSYIAMMENNIREMKKALLP